MSVAATVRCVGRKLVLASLLAGSFLTVPAAAKVTMASDRGFVVRLASSAPASPDKVWAELTNPADWWDSEHTFSGDAANLSFDAKPGGCFCETLPGGEGGAPRGGVQHMTVVYVEKPRALRLKGALGPLQADAVVGTLTIQLKPDETGGGTQILWEYVVGGFLRSPVEAVSTSVDKVLDEQLDRLAVKLGAKPEATPPATTDGDKTAGPPAASDAPNKGEIIGR